MTWPVSKASGAQQPSERLLELRIRHSLSVSERAKPLLGECDLQDEVTVFDRPRRTADQQIIEKVLLGLLDELLSGVTLERWDTTLFDGIGAGSETSQEFFNIELGHKILQS
jgi:hypothetical protein